MNASVSAVLSQINTYSGLAEWITAFIALFALVYAAKEFSMKSRPYIDIEIELAENPNKQQGGWLFFAKLINKGTFPGIVKVKKTEMRIGDEKYPSEVKNKLIISPGESKKSALIGSIYKSGIDKIIAHEYRVNRVEIEIEVESSEIGSKKFKYLTKVVYHVDITGEKPNIFLINENFK